MSASTVRLATAGQSRSAIESEAQDESLYQVGDTQRSWLRWGNNLTERQ